jgi:protein O-mannosyl-transferase
LFALPATLFLVWRWPRSKPGETFGLRTWLPLSAYFAGPFVLGGTAYLVARMTRFGAGDPAVNYVLSHFRYGPFDAARVFFKVFGFYVKKLFVPVPLNFAIISANDHYIWLGLLVFLLAIILLTRRWLMGHFLVVSFFLTLPALIISLTDVAWTPLAERYLYLSSAFWSIAVVGGGYLALQRLPANGLFVSFSALLLLVFGWVTFERNVIWQSNLTLFQDTVEKSPNYPPARNDLAIALMAEGRYDEAHEQLKIAQRLDPDRKAMNVYLNEAHVLLGEQKYEEATAVLDNLLMAEEKPSLKFLQHVAGVYERLLLEFEEGESLRKVRGQLETIYQQIYQKTHDPFIRYRQAKLAMFRGDEEKAGAYFAEAYRRAPATAHYKQPALILAKKMIKK